MAKVKETIWDIDTNRFSSEVKGAKGKMLMMYHRDAVGTVLPYNVDVDHRFKTIHIGAPGNETQIKYFQNLYGLKTQTEVITAISENILVEMAYDIYELPKERKNKVVQCTIEKLFGRKPAELPELVLDVWSVVMEQMEARDIRKLAELNRDIHTMAARMINKRRPLIMALRDAYNKCPDDDAMAIIKRDTSKYPQEVSSTLTNDLIQKERCPELLLFFKEVGIDLLGNINRGVSIRYRRSQSEFLEKNKIYTEKELATFNKRYVSQKARSERKPVKFIQEKFDMNSPYFI